MSDERPGEDYDLDEPVASILSRFNHDAFFWGAWWAWSHGMHDWGLVLSLGPAVVMAPLLVGRGGMVLTAVLLPIWIALPLYFARNANRILWQRDRDRFYEVFRTRQASKPVSTRERLTVALLFAPLVLVPVGAIVWGFVERVFGI